jgi:hypothetical protein
VSSLIQGATVQNTDPFPFSGRRVAFWLVPPAAARPPNSHALADLGKEAISSLLKRGWGLPASRMGVTSQTKALAYFLQILPCNFCGQYPTFFRGGRAPRAGSSG